MASLAESDAHAANYRALRPDGTFRQLHSRGRVTERIGAKAITIHGLTMDLTDPEPHDIR